MKISHEVPLCLLEDSLEFNDYQYLLPCLLDKHPKYQQFFLDYGRNGGFIIMDNSLFEGVKHTDQFLMDKIELIKPDIFIVPDEWNDPDQTLINAKRWKNHQKNGMIPQSVNLMAVLQFNYYDEAWALYKSLKEIGYRYIAFNHSSVGYESMFPHSNKIISQMMGRILLINLLKKDGELDESIYHHLLGCSSIKEFQYYKKGYDFIKSVDTSSPIMFSYEQNLYSEDDLYYKPTTPIIKVMEMPYSSFQPFLNVNLDIFRREFKW